MAISFMAVIGIGTLALCLYGLNLTWFLGVVLPYAAVLVFLGGFCCRIVNWAKSPVPFPIALTGGQQKSLPWIKQSKLEAPSNALEVAGRMALEVFLFRSLFRNTKAQMRDTRDGQRLIYWSSKWLWLFALLFHYAFLIILIRHFRFFIDQVPICLQAVEFLDSIMAVGTPVLFQSDVVIVAALLFLFLRRLCDPKLRYITLPNDYFPLFLLLAVSISGISLRYLTKVDIASVKVLTMNLVSFTPTIPDGIGAAFYVHVAFVCVLLMFFPFSKLMHMGGVLLSPTRNMATNSREFRHLNPWNGPKVYKTYAEYEDEFRDAMAEAGLPLEKKKPEAAGAE